VDVAYSDADDREDICDILRVETALDAHEKALYFRAAAQPREILGSILFLPCANVRAVSDKPLDEN